MRTVFDYLFSIKLKAVVLCTVSVLMPGVFFAQSLLPIQPARATWDTGWFQTEVYRQLIEELGYPVDDAVTMENPEFYNQAAAGNVDFWVNGWFPLHNDFFQNANIRRNIEKVGMQVNGGAVQGYMIDKQSAEKLNITSIEDFKRDDVLAHFDTDNDGRAELAGCNPNWGCERLIDHHLSEYGLNQYIDHQKGPYALLMQNVIRRYQQDEPVFFYTWTPNWTIGALQPGRDVIWLEVPFISSPDRDQQSIPLDSLINPPGPQESLKTGFPMNDIRVVANRQFLNKFPDIRELFTRIEIPLEDILAQNAKLLRGESDLAAIRRHARNWIERNQGKVSSWLTAAKRLQQSNILRSPGAAEQLADIPENPLPEQVNFVTQPVEPFVIYEQGSYGGFTIEFLNMLCEQVGVTPSYYAVNSIAKLVDDIDRGSAQAGAAAIAITSNREAEHDFTHSYFDTGLQIMTNGGGDTTSSSMWRVIQGILFSSDVWIIISFFVGTLLLVAHIIWLLERKGNTDFPESYWKGIFVAIWWAAVTITTVGYGDKVPRKLAGRMFALFWLFSGYFIFAYFTATVTSNVTVDKIEGRIRTPNDLYGNTIITINESAAEQFLTEMGINPISYSNIATAVHALKTDKNNAQAIVYDAPVLQYYARNDRSGSLKITGALFEEKSYGILLPENSTFQNKFNEALLEIKEDGRYQTLYRKWFGNNN